MGNAATLENYIKGRGLTIFFLITVIGIGGIISAFFGVILGPITIALLGLGVGVFQADKARQELIKATKKELVKHLPKVAEEQWLPIHQAVAECFDSYEREVIKRVDDDIQARKAELDNLLKQKESREINRGAELERLRNLEVNVSSESRSIEAVYQNLLASAA